MAYIINRFDGTQLTIVDDGILDTSTPVGLIGRNYTGYGEVQNENFIFLLENFANASPPARALSGQAWYDKGAKALKVYNGTTWLSIGNATVSEEEPAHSNGGLWYNSVSNKLYISNGTTYNFVGPEGTDGFLITRHASGFLKDTLGAKHAVIFTFTNRELVSITSGDKFSFRWADQTEDPYGSGVALTQIEPYYSAVITIYRGVWLPNSAEYSIDADGNVDVDFEPAGFQGNLRGIASAAVIAGTSKRSIFSLTSGLAGAVAQPLKAGDFIIGSEFNGAFETTWDINATSENLIGTVVARNSVGGFSATTVNADLFGNVQGNVTAVTGTSTFNEIVVNNITGETFSGLAARTTRLATPRLINTVPFNGTEDITLPVPAETLVGTTLAPNVVDSVLTSLGKLVALEVEAPGIVVGDGNNLNIKIEGFTPTLESDVSNAIKLKLLTGSVTIAPTTVTFISASAANADGILSPAFVPDYTLSTPANQRPVLGLPSHRWKDIYSAAATLDVLKATTLSGRTVADEVTVSNKLIVTNGTYSALFGNVTGNVTGAASLNMLKSGDSMSGDLSWTTTGRGLSWSMNTDTASIRYYNSADNSTDNRLEFNTSDNLDEYFRWTHTTGGNTFESMRLTPTSPGIANLQVTGQITVTSGVSAATYIGNANQLTNLNATQLLTGTIPTARLAGTYNINIVGNLAGNVTGNVQGNLTGNVTGNVTGTASGNLAASGGTLTGDLNWSTTGRGITWGMNTDGASIRFYNTGDGDAASRLEFQTTDNGNEYFSWTHAVSGGGTVEAMRLVPNTVSGTSSLRVFGNVTVDGTASGTFSGTGTSLTLNAANLTTGTVPTARLTGTYAISISGNANSATTASTATNQAGGSVNATTGSFSGRVAQSVSGFHAASKEVISTRTDSGFYDWPNPTTANGWPVNSSWYHLLSSTHVNDANYYAMQFSADFYAQNLYYRSTAGNGATAWNKILHSNNYNDYAPTKTGGGASGTWAINITGNANTVITLNSGQIVSALGFTPISAGALTNQSGTAINGTTATFSGQVNVSTAGIRFPNDPYGGSGDAASITYESVSGERTRLRFRVANDAGITSVDDKAEFIVPDNDSLLVNGYITLNAANYNSYSPTLSGGNASGTWGINVTGSAGSAGSVPWTGVTGKPNIVLNDGGSYSINISGNSNSASSTSVVNNAGNITAETNGSAEPSGLRLRSVYSNGYPTSYGNAITLGGAGGGELLIGWSGSTGAHADNYVRSRRDVGTTWSAWAKLITDVNYNSYAPTLTGGGASGTWGINITGNAASVTGISYQQVVNALGYAPANASDLTRVTTSPLQASNITATGTLTVAQGASLGIRWPNDAFGGGSDTARITLESAGGEATRMRFTMTNDADDQFEFSAPSYNGLTMNGYIVYHWANLQFTSGTNYSISGFTNQVGSWNFGANYFDVYPPGGFTIANLVAFIPSMHVIHFAGGVDGNDSLVCTWSNLGDRIRVYVQNTEQRSTPAANWLAIWRR